MIKGQDNLPHNKLRFYAKLKSSFNREPYIDNVTNRNQRAWLSRLRTSAHSLAIKQGRYSNVPLTAHVCIYCSDTSLHADTAIDVRCTRLKSKDNVF